MYMVTVFWALLSKSLAWLNPFMKFVYTVSFSYQPIQHSPSASEQKPSVVFLTFIKPQQASSTQTFLKINFKSLPEGIFFFCLPIFHFYGLLFASTYSEMCAVDRNTFGKAAPRSNPLLCFFQRAAPVSCGMWSVVVMSA